MPAPVWTDPRYRRFFRGAVRLVERLTTREGRRDHACLARLVMLAAADAPDEPHGDGAGKCAPSPVARPSALRPGPSVPPRAF